MSRIQISKFPYSVFNGLIMAAAGGVQLTVTEAPHIISVLDGSVIPIVKTAPA